MECLWRGKKRGSGFGNDLGGLRMRSTDLDDVSLLLCREGIMSEERHT